MKRDFQFVQLLLFNVQCYLLGLPFPCIFVAGETEVFSNPLPPAVHRDSKDDADDDA